MLIITKGEGIHTIDYQDYKYKKGTVFCLRKGVIHKFTRSSSEGELLVFTEDFIVKHIGELEAMKSLQLFNELIGSPKIHLEKKMFTEVEIILKFIKNEILLERDTYTSTILRSFLNVLTSKLYREKTRNKDVFLNSENLIQFLKFQSLIEKNWAENKKVLYYAKEMSITPRALNKIVKNTIKKTAKFLINFIVITQTKYLLINTELSITEIAYKCGYEDPTNFFKYFKKQTSLSPAQFRNSQK